jgi:hypothetical protein
MNKFSLKNKLFLVAVLGCFAFAKAQSTVSQDTRITELLELKTQLTKDNELTDRYKIQLYSGDRERAYSVLRKFRNDVGTWSSSIEYQTPNYKVWVGNYRNRLEADRALLKIKKKFSSAFIFKPDRR